MQIQRALLSGRKKYRCEEIICHYEMRELSLGCESAGTLARFGPPRDRYPFPIIEGPRRAPPQCTSQQEHHDGLCETRPHRPGCIASVSGLHELWRALARHASM